MATEIIYFDKKGNAPARKLRGVSGVPKKEKEVWEMTFEEFNKATTFFEYKSKSDRLNYQQLFIGLKSDDDFMYYREELQALRRDTLSNEWKSDIKSLERKSLYYYSGGGAFKKSLDIKKVAHAKIIQKAIAENKNIPAEVLAEYPDLMPKKEKEVWENTDNQFFLGLVQMQNKNGLITDNHTYMLSPTQKRDIIKVIDAYKNNDLDTITQIFINRGYQRVYQLSLNSVVRGSKRRAIARDRLKNEIADLIYGLIPTKKDLINLQATNLLQQYNKDSEGLAGLGAKKEFWQMTLDEYLLVAPKELLVASAGSFAKIKELIEEYYYGKKELINLSTELMYRYKVQGNRNGKDFFHKADRVSYNEKKRTFYFEQVKSHEDIIKKAISENKNIPAEVLAEYPDLLKEKATNLLQQYKNDNQGLAGLGAKKDKEVWEMTFEEFKTLPLVVYKQEGRKKKRFCDYDGYRDDYESEDYFVTVMYKNKHFGFLSLNKYAGIVKNSHDEIGVKLAILEVFHWNIVYNSFYKDKKIPAEVINNHYLLKQEITEQATNLLQQYKNDNQGLQGLGAKKEKEVWEMTFEEFKKATVCIYKHNIGKWQTTPLATIFIGWKDNAAFLELKKDYDLFTVKTLYNVQKEYEVQRKIELLYDKYKIDKSEHRVKILSRLNTLLFEKARNSNFQRKDVCLFARDFLYKESYTTCTDAKKIAYKKAIQQAISENKNIPAEVLAEYPDLLKEQATNLLQQYKNDNQGLQGFVYLNKNLTDEQQQKVSAIETEKIIDLDYTYFASTTVSKNEKIGYVYDNYFFVLDRDSINDILKYLKKTSQKIFLHLPKFLDTEDYNSIIVSANKTYSKDLWAITTILSNATLANAPVWHNLATKKVLSKDEVTLLSKKVEANENILATQLIDLAKDLEKFYEVKYIYKGIEVGKQSLYTEIVTVKNSHKLFSVRFYELNDRINFRSFISYFETIEEVKNFVTKHLSTQLQRKASQLLQQYKNDNQGLAGLGAKTAEEKELFLTKLAEKLTKESGNWVSFEQNYAYLNAIYEKILNKDIDVNLLSILKNKENTSSFKIFTFITGLKMQGNQLEIMTNLKNWFGELPQKEQPQVVKSKVFSDKQMQLIRKDLRTRCRLRDGSIVTIEELCKMRGVRKVAGTYNGKNTYDIYAPDSRGGGGFGITKATYDYIDLVEDDTFNQATNLLQQYKNDNQGLAGFGAKSVELFDGLMTYTPNKTGLGSNSTEIEPQAKKQNLGLLLAVEFALFSVMKQLDVNFENIRQYLSKGTVLKDFSEIDKVLVDIELLRATYQRRTPNVLTQDIKDVQQNREQYNRDLQEELEKLYPLLKNLQLPSKAIATEADDNEEFWLTDKEYFAIRDRYAAGKKNEFYPVSIRYDKANFKFEFITNKGKFTAVLWTLSELADRMQKDYGFKPSVSLDSLLGKNAKATKANSFVINELHTKILKRFVTEDTDPRSDSYKTINSNSTHYGTTNTEVLFMFPHTEQTASKQGCFRLDGSLVANERLLVSDETLQHISPKDIAEVIEIDVVDLLKFAKFKPSNDDFEKKVKRLFYQTLFFGLNTKSLKDVLQSFLDLKYKTIYLHLPSKDRTARIFSVDKHYFSNVFALVMPISFVQYGDYYPKNDETDEMGNGLVWYDLETKAYPATFKELLPTTSQTPNLDAAKLQARAAREAKTLLEKYDSDKEGLGSLGQISEVPAHINLQEIKEFIEEQSSYKVNIWKNSRLYLSGRDIYNTNKVKTTAFYYYDESSNSFESSVFIQTNTQPYAWVKSQKEILETDLYGLTVRIHAFLQAKTLLSQYKNDSQGLQGFGKKSLQKR